MFCRVRKIKNKNNSIRYNFYVCYRYRLYYVYGKDKFIFSLKPNESKSVNFDKLQELIKEKMLQVFSEEDIKTKKINFEELTKEMIKLINTTTI